ncbi:ABC transporter ATP-binding protein [Candidatus Latescibacterota bacterium]
MITLEKLSFAYPGFSPVLENLDVTIETGSSVAIMGPNGSGKTTLAYLLKGIFAPTSGRLTVDGVAAGHETAREELMRRVGLVFQNPENTIVTTTVETELAFGLENLGVPRAEMVARVEEALELFQLAQYRHTSPTHLSGGEKQRLALACVMVMNPTCLVLDEPTALLDHPGRRVVRAFLKRLAEQGTTSIHITQFMDETCEADRLIVLDNAGISHDGRPADILPRLTGYRSCGYTPRLVSSLDADAQGCSPQPDGGALITFEDTGFTYDPGTPFAHTALVDITLPVYRQTATVVLGPSGSGKTTLLELAAGIAKPTAGMVRVDGEPVRAMTFQLPEDQMFGQDVASYVAFGPRNIGVTDRTLAGVVDEALTAVGLDPSRYRRRDPLALSGGEKRLVALAGVFAMRPGLLVLDEPTAGLDWEGMTRVIKGLETFCEGGGTLLFSTHDFEVIHALGEYALVLVGGQVEAQGQCQEVLADSTWIQSLGDTAF